MRRFLFVTSSAALALAAWVTPAGGAATDDGESAARYVPDPTTVNPSAGWYHPAASQPRSRRE